MELPSTTNRKMELDRLRMPPPKIPLSSRTPLSSPRPHNRDFPLAVNQGRDPNADFGEFKFLISPHEKEALCSGIRILADALAFSSGFRPGWEGCNKKQWLARGDCVLSNSKLRAETGLDESSLMWFMDLAFKIRLSDDMAQHMEVRKLGYILRAVWKGPSAQYRVVSKIFRFVVGKNLQEFARDDTGVALTIDGVLRVLDAA